MSKNVKSLLRKEIINRLDGVQDLAVVSVVGVDGVTNNRLRGELDQKGIRLLVVKNAMARQALAELKLEKAGELLTGPSALAFGGESVVDVVRELMDKAKAIPQLQVRGALMEGETFGPERVEELSKYPTRIEALGRLSAIATAPGSKLVGAVMGPGSVIAGLLKAIEEKAAPSGESAEGAAAPTEA